MSNRLYVDIHVLQTVPPSCINRDDTGSPKTALYGGSTRARVSSQAWKKAVRESFKQEGAAGIRTKQIVDLVAREIRALESELDEDAAKKKAESILNLSGVTTKEGAAKALFFMSPKQAKELAELAHADCKDKKTAQTALNENPTIDIALFGRMVADDPSLNTDACCQVAHAISTHRIENEYDYFTAVDDLAPEDNAGAGMIGTVEFNSSTLYRYATIAAHDLEGKLGGEDAAASAVKNFAKAFISSMPTGKQNTFANLTPPFFALVIIREDTPVNLVGAFESAIKASKDSGFAAPSVVALEEYATKVWQDWYGEPVMCLEVGKDGSFPEVLDTLKESVVALLEGNSP